MCYYFLQDIVSSGKITVSVKVCNGMFLVASAMLCVCMCVCVCVYVEFAFDNSNK